jgi:hypothetical protein
MKYLFGFAAMKRFNHGRIVNNKFTNVKQIVDENIVEVALYFPIKILPNNISIIA